MATPFEHQLELKLDAALKDAKKFSKKVEKEIDDAGARGGKKAGKAAAKDFETAFKANFAADFLSDMLQNVLGSAINTISDQFSSAFSLAVDFEQQISAITSLGGVSEEAKIQLEDLSFQLGSTTKFSALEAAQGMEELVKAGLSVEQILGGAAKGALDLAAAGTIEVAEAAEVASVVLNVFRKDALDVTRAADLLAGAANATQTDVHQLKYALSQAAVNSASVGLTFEDTATTLAVLAENGVLGSDAGTSLKTMLTRLVPTTEKAALLFDKLGLNFFNASGEMKSMTEIAENLQEAYSGLTAAERIEYGHTLFGSDASRAANALANSGAEGFERLNEAMNAVTAAEVAAEKTANFAGAWERLNAAIDTLKIQAVKELFPIITPWIDKAANALSGIKFDDIKNFMKETFANPEVKNGLEFMAGFLGTILVAALAKLGLGVAAFTLTWLASPLGMISTIVGAAVASLFTLDEDGTIHLTNFGESVKGFVESFGVDIGGAIESVKGFIDELLRVDEDGRNGVDRFMEHAKEKLKEYGLDVDGATEATKGFIDELLRVDEDGRNSLDRLGDGADEWAESMGVDMWKVRDDLRRLGDDFNNADGKGNLAMESLGEGWRWFTDDFGMRMELMGWRLQSVWDEFLSIFEVGSPANVAVGDWVRDTLSWFGELGTGIDSVLQGISDGIYSMVSDFNNMINQVTNKQSTLGADITRLQNSVNDRVAAAPGNSDAQIRARKARDRREAARARITGFKARFFAEGTSYAPGGWAQVNERGQEMMLLPNGAQVIPREYTENIMNTTIGSNNTTNNYGTSYRSLSSTFGYQS